MDKDLQNTIRIAGIVSNLYRSGSSNGSELSSALEDFAKKAENVKWALAGGLAVGFHSRPRGTQDVDVIVKNEQDIDTIQQRANDQFKRHRSHAFEHKRTGVEVEVLTAQFLGIDQNIVENAIENSNLQQVGDLQIPVVDESGLIAMKLQRSSRQDLADIEAILRNNKNIDLSSYPLTKDQLNIFEEIRKDIEK
jgi:hypothetical protein